MAKFSKAFWVANTVELLERLAYYAVFIVITLYLSNILGFSDGEAGIIAGVFSALLYFLPTFMGAYADKIGFRKSIIIAFALLTLGYAGLGVLPTLLDSAGLVSYGTGKGDGSFSNFFRDLGFEFGTETAFSGLESSMGRWAIAPILILIVIGGAFIKSVISGTVAKETTSANRARGFAIFYMMVNIGAFTGKTVVDPLRRSLGDMGLVYLNYFSAAMTLIALITVFFFYRSTHTAGEGKSFSEIWTSLKKLCCNGRLVALILIVAGFWVVQQQMYASMPKYILRMVGDDASPGWIANVNPFVVFVFVNLVTTLMRRRKALTSMTIGMFIIPFSALLMAAGNMMDSSPFVFNIMNPFGDLPYVISMHPITLMMILGIACQAIAECFISPRFLEYFSLQSPKGEEGLYLGFSHLHSFFSSLIAFISAGFLLEKFCPDPKKFANVAEHAAASQNAHYLWLVFFFVGLVSAIALIIYGRVVRKLDAKVVEN